MIKINYHDIFLTVFDLSRGKNNSEQLVVNRFFNKVDNYCFGRDAHGQLLKTRSDKTGIPLRTLVKSCRSPKETEALIQRFSNEKLF